jgi:hypothetical protein
LLLFSVRAFVTLPALLATQLVQVPVRLVMTPEVGVPSRGVVRLMLVTVVPLGSARTPVALVLIVALPDVDPFSVRLPPVPPFAPNVGVAVQLAAVPLVAFGTEPAVALVAFVPPLPIAKVALSPAAVPVVFWLNVGKFVKFVALKVGADVKVGAAVEPVKFPKTVFAPTVAAPVPPLATASVPPSVTAPEVADDGVNPVVPAENVETVPAVVAHVAHPIAPAVLIVIGEVPLKPALPTAAIEICAVYWNALPV